MSIPRLDLIQSLINKNKYSNYLEIGVSIGTVFFRVRCKNKIAVDPEFGFNKFKILTRTIRLYNYSNLAAKYYEKTSDDFFAENAKKSINGKLDICLVDGMHEYSFALKDIQNTIRYLSDDGVIIVHDCNPKTADNAVTFDEWKKREFTGEWNGDVWRTIVYLRSLRPDITAFVADMDQGLGIVTKKPAIPEKSLAFKSFEEIQKLDFNDFHKNREAWIGLQPSSYLNEYFGLDIKFS